MEILPCCYTSYTTDLNRSDGDLTMGRGYGRRMQEDEGGCRGMKEDEGGCRRMKEDAGG
jgi:hypothetical protein